MKQLSILALGILFIHACANCQITKGNWLVGGNIGFTSTNFKSDAGSKSVAFDLNIAPNVGYFIVNRFSAGIKSDIEKSGYRAPGTSVSSTYIDFNLGPFIRYYLLPQEHDFNFFTEGSYLYGFTADNLRRLTSKNTFLFNAGAEIFFTNSVGLEFLIGYSTYKNKGFQGSNNTIRFGLGIQAHLEKNK